jgi:hypothetical protein
MPEQDFSIEETQAALDGASSPEAHSDD